jgi:excisionase family DNA binding protein
MENNNNSLQLLQEINSKLERIQEVMLVGKSVFSVEDVCRYTGLSKSYLYKLTSAGLIPYSKPVGKLVYFSKDEIDRWLLGRKRKSSAEQEQEACNYLTFKNRSDARG